MAQKYAEEIIEKNRIDVKGTHNYELVNTDTISNHDIVEIGAEWVCQQALNQLRFDEILHDCNFNVEEQRLAYTCLLYTSDAADERSSVDLGGRRIIKKKTIK